MFTIEEAVAAGSFHEHEGFTDHEIVDGDPDGAMAACEAAGAWFAASRGAADRNTFTSNRWRISCGAGITTNW